MLDRKNVESDRLLRVWILPALFGLAVAAALGLPFGMLPQMADRGVLEDFSTAVDLLRSRLSILIVVVTIVGSASAVGWFARCWRTRFSRAGTARNGRTAWLRIGVGGLLASYVAAGYTLWVGSPFGAGLVGNLWVSLSGVARIAILLFVGPFYFLTYWAISVLCTHAVYVPAIPWSTWRT